ncbi:MAG TPA: DUF177 domain-containing protein [Vicinamibacterales bacterium]|nr:DUF177 domain-containing protein [Vicinamibacterales bacterium]
MLLDLNKLQGQREHVERALPSSAFEPQDDQYRLIAPVELSMDVQKAGDDVFHVTGSFRTRLELDCSRCLEPFELPVEASFDLRYFPQTANAGEGEREIEEEDLTTAYYRDGVLDVIDLLREQLQLALPMKPLHDEACRGLCPVCGGNLNRTDCDHSSKWEDPRLAPLKGLLARDREKES